MKPSAQRVPGSHWGQSAKVYVPRTSSRVRTEKQDCTTVRMKGWAARLPHRLFSPQSGLQTPTSSLGWSFWSLGWEGSDAFGRVLFDSSGSLPLIPHSTHRGARAQTSAFSPSAWSTALTPPGGRGIVIQPSLQSFAGARDADVGVFSSPVH